MKSINKSKKNTLIEDMTVSSENETPSETGELEKMLTGALRVNL